MTRGDALQLVVDLAVQLVAGVTGASVSVVDREDGHLQTANASSEIFCELDEQQYQARAGPCVAAIDSGDEQLIVVGEGKYFRFEQAAAQAGIGHVWSLPLAGEETRSGALNLYSIQVGPQANSNPGSARALAGLAANLLAGAAALDRAHAAEAHLWAALAPRALIGQAQGIVMAREHIDPDRAFDILRRGAQRTNRKLLDLAAELVAATTGDPDPDHDDHADR